MHVITLSLKGRFRSIKRLVLSARWPSMTCLKRAEMK